MRSAPSSPWRLVRSACRSGCCSLLVPLLMLPIGYVVERGLIQRVFHTGDRHVTTLLLTFGLALVLEERAQARLRSESATGRRRRSRGAIEVVGIFLPLYRLFLIVFGAVDHRRRRARRLSHAARRDGARRRLRPQHGGFARRAGAHGSMPAPSPSASRSRASPACCWRRSIRCFPPWAATSSCSPSRSSSSAAWAALPARWSPGCCSPRCRRSPRFTSPRSGPIPIVFGIMVLMLIVRPQGLFGRLGHA